MPLLKLDDRPVALMFRSPLSNASESFVQAQAAGLRRYQPVVLGVEDKGNTVEALRHRRVLPRSAGERWSMTVSGDFAPMLARIVALRPRLIHAQFGPDGLRAMPLAKRLGIPLITTFRGYDMQCGKASLLLSGRLSWMRYALGMSRLARSGAWFLTVSEALRRNALARGFPEDRTTTLFDGIDLDRFASRGDPRPERMILTVGRLVEKKGTALLLTAFAAIAARFPDTCLVIAGDGPLRPALERQAKALGVADRVTFTGFVIGAEVSALMRRAWLLAVPSITARNGDGEGLPTVIFEAAASALPVVGSRHAGITEAIADGETGLLVDEGDVPGLAIALARLLGDDAMWQRFSHAIRRFAEQRFDARRQIDQLEALYDRVRAAHGDFGNGAWPGHAVDRLHA